MCWLLFCAPERTEMTCTAGTRCSPASAACPCQHCGDNHMAPARQGAHGHHHGDVGFHCTSEDSWISAFLLQGAGVTLQTWCYRWIILSSVTVMGKLRQGGVRPCPACTLPNCPAMVIGASHPHLQAPHVLGVKSWACHERQFLLLTAMITL